MILDLASKQFETMARYQPVINGVGGNLVSVQASRISTALHRDCQMGELPGKLPGAPNKVLVSPWTVFFKLGKPLLYFFNKLAIAIATASRAGVNHVAFLSDLLDTASCKVMKYSRGMLQQAIIATLM